MAGEQLVVRAPVGQAGAARADKRRARGLCAAACLISAAALIARLALNNPVAEMVALICFSAARSA
jgi:hypothetical protein